MSFETLGLSQPLLRAIVAQGYTSPTPIQTQAIPHILAGRDVLGCAQTGTGKTAAFALPTLHRFLQPSTDSAAPSAPRHAAASHAEPHHPAASRHERSRGPHPSRRPIRALVLAPTRELALQISESFSTYGQYSGLRAAVVFGGVSQGQQVRALQQGVDVLIATPGRLLDLMEQGYVRLGSVEVLILDEADQMLDMGFLPPLKRIVSQVPRRRQTLLFSATMPKEIRELAEDWLNQPVEIKVAPVGTPAERVKQSVFLVDSRDKPRLLTHYLNDVANTRTLVFTRTKHGADKVVKHLEKSGIRAAAIHGNKSQNLRQRVLAQFRSEEPPILVATDIAARGLDIDSVSHVINFDMPQVPEIYVHRIGRTGRAGAGGIAISFCSREERDALRQIERLTRKSIPVLQHTLPARPPEESTARVPTRAPSAPKPAFAGSGPRRFGGGSRGRSRSPSRYPSR